MLAVLGALFANGIITILKFIAAVIVNLRDEMVTGNIVHTIEEVEDLIRRAEPKVEMIFLEAARQSESIEHDVVPEHIG